MLFTFFMENVVKEEINWKINFCFTVRDLAFRFIIKIMKVTISTNRICLPICVNTLLSTVVHVHTCRVVPNIYSRLTSSWHIS